MVASLLGGLLVLRAASLQILPNDRLQVLKDRQFQTVITLQSRRGAIVDRRGRDLAISTKAFSVYADPKLIEGKKALAKKLAKLFGTSTEHMFSKIKDPKRRFVWIQRLISDDKAEQIRAWDVRGLQLVEEFKRVYPNESLLSSTLGSVGREGIGLEGLELMYNQSLSGSKKKVTVRRDARGRPLVADGMMFAENPDGAEVRLTIDSELQHMLESELNRAQFDHDADQTFGVVLDAKTSAILAIASSPGFDANQALKVTADRRRNRIVTDAFEPGSVMKTFVIAAALREGIIAPNTKYNTENGKMKIGDRIVREADETHKWGKLTVSEILALSSNIGTTKIAFDLGPESLRRGLEDFGIGVRSGVDLPGEARGTLHPLPWQQHLLSNISFGHGVAASALQVANAYAAIANGGVLNTPYIVQSTRDLESGEVVEVKPKAIRRVLDPQTASSMRLILTGVTAPGGTGVNAKVDGFLVAGKTGTAQKVNPNGRGYLDKAYISSFAGFLPANDPKFVIYVAVDHPKKASYYGSQVAAPMFSRIASYAVRQEGLPPMLLSDKNLLRETQTESKIKTSARKKLSMAAQNILNETANEDGKEIVPDLRDLTLRQVLQRLSGKNIDLRIRGQGVVSETFPGPGEEISSQRRLTVILR